MTQPAFRPNRAISLTGTRMPKHIVRLALVLAGITGARSALVAQEPATTAPVRSAATPDSLAALVMKTFSSGTPAEFAAIFPDSAGRVFMRSRQPKQSDLAQVIRREPGQAVLLL